MLPRWARKGEQNRSTLLPHQTPRTNWKQTQQEHLENVFEEVSRKNSPMIPNNNLGRTARHNIDVRPRQAAECRVSSSEGKRRTCPTRIRDARMSHGTGGDAPETSAPSRSILFPHQTEGGDGGRNISSKRNRETEGRRTGYQEGGKRG